jgi:hypothetical protein
LRVIDRRFRGDDGHRRSGERGLDNRGWLWRRWGIGWASSNLCLASR